MAWKNGECISSSDFCLGYCCRIAKHAAHDPAQSWKLEACTAATRNSSDDWGMCSMFCNAYEWTWACDAGINALMLLIQGISMAVTGQLLHD